MTPSPETSVAVIVVSYGSADLLTRNLARSVPEPGPLVVVVENHEDPSVRQATRDLCATRGWLSVEPKSNLGFGGGNNLGVQVALARGARTLVLMNPDLSLAPDGLAALAARSRETPRSVVAPTIVRPDGTPFASGRTLLRLDDGTMLAERRRGELAPSVLVMPWLSGACLALSAETWRDVGGFVAAFFLYWEDVDFSRRVLARGGHLVVDADIVAVHDEGATHRADDTTRAKSETYYYYSIRNRILFARRWLSPAARRRWWWTTPRAVRAVLLQGGRRQLVCSLSPWRAAIRGVRDGFRAERRRVHP